MNEQITASELLERWLAGDESAATELHQRYSQRLVALASARIGEKLRRRIDPEDIVQSVFRTFFRRADQWKLQSDRGGAIWHLLVRITLNKIYSKGEFHSAQQRDVGVEVPLDHSDFHPALMAHDPTPSEAAALAELLEATFASLDDSASEILELAIQGYTASEIAARANCSRWTVRRTLDRVGVRLMKQLTSDE